MDFASFVSQLTMKLQSELGVPGDQIRYYPRGHKPINRVEYGIMQSMNERQSIDADTFANDFFTIEFRSETHAAIIAFPIEDYYQWYLQNQDWSRIMEEIGDKYKGTRIADHYNMEDILPFFDQCRDRLVLIAKCVDDISDWSHLVYRKYGCVCMMPSIRISPDNTESFIPVTKDLARIWDLDEDQVYEAALENMLQSAPVLYAMEDGRETAVRFLEETPNIQLPNVLIVSNESGFLGSGVLYYPGIAEAIYDFCGSFFTLTFGYETSVIIPFDGNFHDLEPFKKLALMAMLRIAKNSQQTLSFYDGDDFWPWNDDAEIDLDDEN